MKRSLLRYGAIAMATASLAVGVAAASSASIDNTGPDSINKVKDTLSNTLNVRNHNDVDVNNRNSQRASSGDAKVKGNTTGGDATTGDASNDNSTTTEITLDNGSCGCLGDLFSGQGGNDASIHLTGPDSTNKIEFRTTNTLTVSNHNDVDVNNSNYQSAYTGDAKVEHNTTGGDATSGDASNTNSTSTSVSISN